MVRDHLPAAATGSFYRKPDEALCAIDFAENVSEICRLAYQGASAEVATILGVSRLFASKLFDGGAIPCDG